MSNIVLSSCTHIFVNTLLLVILSFHDTSTIFGSITFQMPLKFLLVHSHHMIHVSTPIQCRSPYVCFHNAFAELHSSKLFRHIIKFFCMKTFFFWREDVSSVKYWSKYLYIFTCCNILQFHFEFVHFPANHHHHQRFGFYLVDIRFIFCSIFESITHYQSLIVCKFNYDLQSICPSLNRSAMTGLE